MDSATACDRIRQLIYKPGWRLQPLSRSDGRTITVCAEVPARESSRDEAPYGYPTPITLARQFDIDVKYLDDLELYRQVCEGIMSIEEHEMREFLRVKGTWDAPFHPHRRSGEMAWERTKTHDRRFVGVRAGLI